MDKTKLSPKEREDALRKRVVHVEPMPKAPHEARVTREAAAYHEAGHACAAAALGHYIRDATIVADPETETLGHVPTEEWGDCPASAPPAVRQRYAQRHVEEVLVWYAGHAALLVFGHARDMSDVDANAHGAGSDYESAARYTDPREREGLKARTVNLIRKHRPSIETVATLLLRHETVSADVVQCVVGDGLSVVEAETFMVQLAEREKAFHRADPRARPRKPRARR